MMIFFGICSLINGISMMMKAMDTSALRTMLFGVGSAQIAFALVGVCMIAAGVFTLVNGITKQKKFATVARVLLLIAAVSSMLFGHNGLREMIGTCLFYSMSVLWYHKSSANA